MNKKINKNMIFIKKNVKTKLTKYLFPPTINDNTVNDEHRKSYSSNLNNTYDDISET